MVIFCLPFAPEGVFFKKGFNWSAVNYAPLVTIGVMLAVTIWFAVSAKKTFKGPVRTIDELDSDSRAAGHRAGPVGGGQAVSLRCWDPPTAPPAPDGLSA